MRNAAKSFRPLFDHSKSPGEILLLRAAPTKTNPIKGSAALVKNAGKVASLIRSWHYILFILYK